MDLQDKKVNQDTSFTSLQDILDNIAAKHNPNLSNDS